MHFVGMLACGLDVKIGFNKSLTAFSAFVAIIFTFAALSTAYVSEAVENSRVVQAIYKSGREIRDMSLSWFREGHQVDVERGGYLPVSSVSDAEDEEPQVDGRASQIGRHEDEDEEDEEEDYRQPNGANEQVPSRSRTPSLSRDQHVADVPAEEFGLPAAGPSFGDLPSDPTPIAHPRAGTRSATPPPRQRGTPPSHDGSMDSLSNTDDSSELTFNRSRSNSQGSISLSGTTTTSSTWNESLHAGLSRETRMRIKAQATDRPMPKFGWRYWSRQHYKALNALVFIRAAIWGLAIVFMHYSGESSYSRVAL